jgi:hypothetical protein
VLIRDHSPGAIADGWRADDVITIAELAVSVRDRFVTLYRISCHHPDASFIRNIVIRELSSPHPPPGDWRLAARGVRDRDRDRTVGTPGRRTASHPRRQAVVGGSLIDGVAAAG